MSPSSTLTPSAAVWRDYDPVACALPGMFLGDIALTGPVAEECDRLWELGARRVRLSDVVDLADSGTPDAAARAVRTLSLVRDLTARAVLVEWDLRPDPDGGATATEDISRLLSHLQPPQRIEGVDPTRAEDALRTWRNGHYLGKCLWRRGPGFVQIRDRRWGDLRRFTVDEPHYQGAIERLAYGAPASAVPSDALADLREERLVLAVGDVQWWLPYRVNRWIQEAMTI